jgi:hypothetical protein
MSELAREEGPMLTLDVYWSTSPHHRAPVASRLSSQKQSRVYSKVVESTYSGRRGVSTDQASASTHPPSPP